MVNQQLKVTVNEMGHLVDIALKKVGVEADGMQVAKVELAEFLMYLSASDGKIEWNEANNIAEYLEMPATPEVVNGVIREQNIYSTEFEQKIPLTFQVVVKCDNLLWDNGKRSECSADLALKLYKAVGEELLATDGNVDANERQDFNIYINMLENYINQNDKFKQNGAIYTGLTKNQGGLGVDAPIKSGVSAPRKR